MTPKIVGSEPVDEAKAASFENWLQIFLLVVVAIVGWKVIGEYGEPRFGDPAVCDGIGFGCSPNQFGDFISVWFALATGLAMTALARLLVPTNYRWSLTAAGVAFACALCGLVWRGNIIRYGVPDISVAEGRAEARRLLGTMRAAVGVVPPLDVADESSVPAVPTPGAVIAAITERQPVRCLDTNDHDTGTSRYEWGIRRTLFLPRAALLGDTGDLVTLPPPVSEQLQALQRVLDPEATDPRDGPTFWEVATSRPGPPPRTTDYLPSYSFSARVSMGFVVTADPSMYQLTVQASVGTPCLRRAR